MATIETHAIWLRRFTIPSIVLTLIVTAWSIAMGFAGYGMLGITIGSVNGTPLTFVDKLLIQGVGGAILAVFLHCLLLLVFFVGRISFRWWLVALILVVLGTPLGLFSCWQIADYLWTRNLGGTPWEKDAPQAIGVLFAWIASLFFGMWMNRYRFVVIKRDDTRKSPCPRCGYELLGNKTGRCPECGWMIPVFMYPADEIPK